MNVFDAGGLTMILAIIFTLILGTGLFILINTIFEIWYLGFGAMIGEWLICCAVSAFIVNWMSGLIGGLFTILWFLIKLVIVIVVLLAIGSFIYSKVKGKNS